MKFPEGIEVVASALIVDSQKRILLFKSPKWKANWCLPGGHVNPGEKLIDAAKSEGERNRFEAKGG